MLQSHWEQRCRPHPALLTLQGQVEADMAVEVHGAMEAAVAELTQAEGTTAVQLLALHVVAYLRAHASAGHGLHRGLPAMARRWEGRAAPRAAVSPPSHPHPLLAHRSRAASRPERAQGKQHEQEMATRQGVLHRRAPSPLHRAEQGPWEGCACLGTEGELGDSHLCPCHPHLAGCRGRPPSRTAAPLCWREQRPCSGTEEASVCGETMLEAGAFPPIVCRPRPQPQPHRAFTAGYF